MTRSEAVLALPLNMEVKQESPRNPFRCSGRVSYWSSAMITYVPPSEQREREQRQAGMQRMAQPFDDSGRLRQFIRSMSGRSNSVDSAPRQNRGTPPAGGG